MKHRIVFSLLSAFVMVLVPLVSVGLVHASAVTVFPSNCTADICKDNAADAKKNPLFGPSGVLTEVIHILAIFVGVVATISVLIAGFMAITAAGDSTKVANARRALLYALIGLFVAAVAQTIVIFVLDRIAP
jgi:hypothetical protein